MITLFASLYNNICNPTVELLGDMAINRSQTSIPVSYDVSSLEEAVRLFQASKEYFDFCNAHLGVVYTYQVLDSRCVKRVDMSGHHLQPRSED